MHDLIFAKEIKKIVDEKLKNLNKKINLSAINVRLSPFTHVKPETLKTAFIIEVKGSQLERIPLNIKMSEVEIACNTCNKRFLVTAPVFSCPKCKSVNLHIKQEPEFFVESIEGVNKNE